VARVSIGVSISMKAVVVQEAPQLARLMRARI
jgi:hypothetical protein